jgi:hypothetical protein
VEGTLDKHRIQSRKEAVSSRSNRRVTATAIAADWILPRQRAANPCHPHCCKIVPRHSEYKKRELTLRPIFWKEKTSMLDTKKLTCAAAVLGLVLTFAASKASAQVPGWQIQRGLTVRQAGYNTAVFGQALYSVPPYAYGYNPYPRIVTYRVLPPVIYSAPIYTNPYAPLYVNPYPMAPAISYNPYLGY